MKYIKIIGHFLLYCFYVLITLDRRSEYQKSLDIGYRVMGSERKHDIFGTDVTYYYDRTQKPKRNYLTWREFWEMRGYYKQAPKKESVIFDLD